MLQHSSVSLLQEVLLSHKPEQLRLLHLDGNSDEVHPRQLGNYLGFCFAPTLVILSAVCLMPP
jgi:hypothetical protein